MQWAVRPSLALLSIDQDRKNAFPAGLFTVVLEDFPHSLVPDEGNRPERPITSMK
jgi:hypothetical protein